MLWMFQARGRSRQYATGDISSVMTNGPYRFGASLVFWCFRFRFLASSQTCSPFLYCAGDTPPCFAALLIASIARPLFSMSMSTLFSAMSLFDGGVAAGCRVGSYPIKTSLGDSPVVMFFLLLCTAVAMVSQWVQSSGDAEVTRRRYCSTHWFFRSDSPSV